MTPTRYLEGEEGACDERMGISWSIVQLVLSTKESLESVANFCSKLKLYFPPPCLNTCLGARKEPIPCK